MLLSSRVETYIHTRARHRLFKREFYYLIYIKFFKVHFLRKTTSSNVVHPSKSNSLFICRLVKNTYESLIDPSIPQTIITWLRIFM